MAILDRLYICLDTMFEFLPHKVFHNVFLITPFPLVCQPSGLWGHLEWRWGYQYTGADYSTSSFSFANKIELPSQPSATPARPCNLCWPITFHNLFALSKGVTVQTRHLFCACGCIRYYAANLGLMIFVQEWRGREFTRVSCYHHHYLEVLQGEVIISRSCESPTQI